MHILVIDDQQLDRYIIKRTLQPVFDVTTLASAKEARAFASSQTFDVALINVMLVNDLDGIDLLHDLQALQPGFVPMAMSCYVDEFRREKLEEAGFLSILKKPFTRDEVHRHVSYHQWNLYRCAKLG